MKLFRMKHTFKILFLLSFVVCLLGACKKTVNKEERTRLSGHVSNPVQGKIYLEYISLSDDSRFPKEVLLDSLGNFAIELELPETALINIDAGSPQAFGIILSDKQQLHVDFNASTLRYRHYSGIDTLGSDLAFSGTLEAVSTNQMLYELLKAQYSGKYPEMGISNEEYRKIVDSNVALMQKVIEHHATMVPAASLQIAKKELELYRLTSEKNIRLNFYFTYLKERVKDEKELWDQYMLSYMNGSYNDAFEACYKNFSTLDSSVILVQNFYEAQGDYASYIHRQNPEIAKAEPWSSSLMLTNKGYQSQKLREYLMFTELKNVAPMASDEAFTYFSTHCSDTSLLRRVLLEKARGIGNGHAFPEFDARTVADMPYSMINALMLDKPIYVDFWATWCSPCKAQMPFLEKLEKEYEGKITFLSISMDKESDFNKWKNMVQEKKLGGEQVLIRDDFNSNLAKKLSLSSIPRFILLDNDGKIVDIDAPKPSDEQAVRVALDKMIK